MKCKLCGKTGVRLSHWRIAHKDWLRRKMNSPAARAKAARTRAKNRAAEERENRPQPRAKARSQKEAHFEAYMRGYPAPPIPQGHFCSVCGRGLWSVAAWEPWVAPKRLENRTGKP